MVQLLPEDPTWSDFCERCLVYRALCDLSLNGFTIKAHDAFACRFEGEIRIVCSSAL
jgi:hypothetical protein